MLSRLNPPPTFPYDPLEWVRLPLPERARLVCALWAERGYGAPPVVLMAYALKVLLYIGGWAFFCSFSPTLGGLGTLPTWWLHPLAFQKAVVFSLLFEVLGLGCGSGPLTGRYVPPVGGFLYFLRPGTTKLPLWPRLPLLGGHTRSALDVALYAALLLVTLRALLAPTLGFWHFAPLLGLLPLLGVADRTLFLAARSEHYLTMVLCFACASDWIPGAKAVQLALWFWAGVSKATRHFPAVICVMTSNSPCLSFPWLRRRMYRDFPNDLRPSRLAKLMSHMGAALELAVPLAFLLTPLGQTPVVALLLMLLLHGYITSNVPMGVPIEWNFMMVYGGFALFYAHPAASLTALAPPWLVGVLLVVLVVVPLLGNLAPRWVSFLPAMRYYAGNWAYSIWFVRYGAERKLERLRKSSALIYEQLGPFFERPTIIGMTGMVMGFRLMHLHGRALPILVPLAVDDLTAYDWFDGELIAGLALGWNFGDGHLHQEQLLQALQAQCGFTEGEVRCIFVESQPLLRGTLDYRIWDAASGQLEAGSLPVAELETRQPWEAPPGVESPALPL